MSISQQGALALGTGLRNALEAEVTKQGPANICSACLLSDPMRQQRPDALGSHSNHAPATGHMLGASWWSWHLGNGGSFEMHVSKEETEAQRASLAPLQGRIHVVAKHGLGPKVPSSH